jgi:hypothetical protein
LTKFAKISGKYVLFDVAVFDLQYTLLVRQIEAITALMCMVFYTLYFPTKVQTDLADKTSICLTKSVYCKSNTATSNKTYLPEILANCCCCFPGNGRHDGNSVSDEMARKFRSENFWDFTKFVD